MPTFNSRVRLQSLLAKEACWRRPPPVTVASAAESAIPMPAAAPDSAPALMPKGPLRLTDDQLAAVLHAAEPLAIGDLGAFLQDVAAALQGQELGDGTVYRAIAQAQRQYYPPILTPGSRWEC
jgi:hypothetical protein